MENYIGMNFKKWCELDEDDERTMHLHLKGEYIEKSITSKDIIDGMTMRLIQLSKIKEIKMIDNEWYIDLVLKKEN